MEKSEEKKSSAGRKAGTDNKYRIEIYVRPSVVKKNGGEDKMKNKIYKHIGQKD